MQAGSWKGRIRHNGFTYIVMLFALAIFGIGLAALGETWSAVSRREKEQELIQIGEAYINAIHRYVENSPGAVKNYPATLYDLVEDKRYTGVQRYLRQVYRDPLTADGVWGIVSAPDGGIMGVHSLCNQPTLLRQAHVLKDGVTVISGERYADWIFIYRAK